MNYKAVLLIAAIGASGCGGNGVQEAHLGDDVPDSCQGFMSPGANIFVYDALSNNLIEDATVTVNVIGESTGESYDAAYISGNDNLSNSESGAYFTFTDINERNYLINVVVRAGGYKDYFSEDMEFVVNTNCGAENNLNYVVHLCREETQCQASVGDETAKPFRL